MMMRVTALPAFLRRVTLLTLALGLVLGLALASGAAASRIATGSLRTAIVRAGDPSFSGPGYCLVVRVTTKDGGNWATVGFNAARANSCTRWGFNGVDIVHRAHSRWRSVTAGSAEIPCGRFGIPVAVRTDLRLPCR